MVEVFSGTAGFTAACRRAGLTQSVGIDAHVNKQTKSPVLKLNLLDEHGVELLFRILWQDNIVYCHLGPPCGTSSRAREIQRPFGANPKPLRSTSFPDGLLHLTGVPLQRVRAANQLYLLTSRIFALCQQRKIFCSVENPARSHFWMTSFFRAHLHDFPGPIFTTQFHHCMYGSRRRKSTVLMHNVPSMQSLAVQCDGLHEHLKWGFNNNKWSTAEEVEYPHKLCTAIADCVRQQLFSIGVLPLPQDLATSLSQDFDTRQTQVGANLQPRGRRVKPLVQDGRRFHLLDSPLKADLPVPPDMTFVSDHAVRVLPKGTKIIQCRPLDLATDSSTGAMATDSSVFIGENSPPCQDRLSRQDGWVEATLGLPWTPDEFLLQAKGACHPKQFVSGISKDLEQCIADNVSCSKKNLAASRTEQMRKWMMRALELRDDESRMKNDMPQHRASVLGTKRILLFREMLLHIGYGDAAIAEPRLHPFTRTMFVQLQPRREKASSIQPGVKQMLQSLAKFSALP